MIRDIWRRLTRDDLDVILEDLDISRRSLDSLAKKLGKEGVEVNFYGLPDHEEETIVVQLKNIKKPTAG